MNTEQIEQFNATFKAIVSGSRFIADKLQIMADLSTDVRETEEFDWYSTILIAIQNNEPLSIEEKVHFLAVHRTFLQLTN